MSLNHPDPEGHLTDITITELVKFRDWMADTAKANDDVQLAVMLIRLDAILEPWGEAPITDDH